MLAEMQNFFKTLNVLSCNLCWVSFVIFAESLRNAFTRVRTGQLCHSSFVSRGGFS